MVVDVEVVDELESDEELAGEELLEEELLELAPALDAESTLFPAPLEEA